MRRTSRNPGPPLLRGLSRAAVLLAALFLLAAPNLDVHRAQEVGASFGAQKTLIAEAAVHPGAPLHMEESPETEEAPCAFCLFSSQIGSGLVATPVPLPHLEVRTAAPTTGIRPALAASRPTLPSRAPPAA